jgi:hypothetical protein
MTIQKNYSILHAFFVAVTMLKSIHSLKIFVLLAFKLQYHIRMNNLKQILCNMMTASLLNMTSSTICNILMFSKPFVKLLSNGQGVKIKAQASSTHATNTMPASSISCILTGYVTSGFYAITLYCIHATTHSLTNKFNEMTAEFQHRYF